MHSFVVHTSIRNKLSYGMLNVDVDCIIRTSVILQSEIRDLQLYT